MQLKTKAVNNLFLFNVYHPDDASAEAYANALLPKPTVEDLRRLEEKELFSRLKALDMPLEKEEFFQLTHMVDTPEEAATLLIDTAKIPPLYETLYLLVFELWRRLVPERKTLSIFCDELDRQIFFYNQGSLKSDESLQKALSTLEQILQESADRGKGKEEIRSYFDAYLAHDIEHFLYEYITDHIGSDAHLYAEELLDSFYFYMRDFRWFDFLYSKLIYPENPSAANEALRMLMQELVEHPDLDLQLEILHFMIESCDRKSFIYLVEKTVRLIQLEEDFLELLDLASEYYLRLDEEEVQEQIDEILVAREKRSPQRFSKDDPDVQEFLRIIQLDR